MTPQNSAVCVFCGYTATDATAPPQKFLADLKTNGWRFIEDYDGDTVFPVCPKHPRIEHHVVDMPAKTKKEVK